MQPVNLVDVRVENGWHRTCNDASHSKRGTSTVNRGGQPAVRIRTNVTNRTKSSKAKSCHIPQQVIQPKQVQSADSQISSSNREHWIPPPGRSTKGQKFSWQSSKARLEIKPAIENAVDDVVSDDDDDEDVHSQNLDRDKLNGHKQSADFSTEQDAKLQAEIQAYEKRIQGLIENVGMLKERARNRANLEETDQLRSDINSCLQDLEQAQQISYRTPTKQSCSQISQRSLCRRNSYRSSSADEPRNRKLSPRVSFKDDPIINRRRARSTTPVRGSLYLNPERERLLISLSESEADIAQITKQLSYVKDTLTKLKLENYPVSFEVDQLNQQRNQLLDFIERFEHSNRKLRDFIRNHYHLEAEHAIVNRNDDTILTRVHELEKENEEIRRLLCDRENDNLALHTELERIRTHTIGFDTMKTTLENNRAHLQRELYAKEGEINRLHCAVRSLERDLQRSRHQCEAIQRSVRRVPIFPASSCPTAPAVVAKTKEISIEKLQAQINERDRQIEELARNLYGDQSEDFIDASAEIVRLRTKLEHAERLVAEYKEQLHTQALKTSLDNSKTHATEIELEKMRVRLQKRLEELEPLPELLRQVEMKNQELETRNLEQERRLVEQAAYIAELSSKTHTHYQVIDRMKESHYSADTDHRALQQKIDALQRQVIALEEENASLIRNLNAKEEALRNSQSRLNAKSHELTSMSKQINLTQTDIKAREETMNCKERTFQQRISELEQQIAKYRLECTQSKREKDELERRYTSQLGELRDKLEQSNNNNRSMQNYVNSLKTTYATVFNDTLPPPSTATSLARFSTTPSIYP